MIINNSYDIPPGNQLTHRLLDCVPLIILFLLTIFYASTAYCQPVNGIKGIGQEEAVELAKEWTQSAHPSLNLKNMKAEAFFVTKENQWIVRLSHPSSPDAVVYMVRVEATSGHSPQFLQGSQVERYEPYFEKGHVEK